MSALSNMLRGHWSLGRLVTREPVPTAVPVDGLTWTDNGRGYATCGVVGRVFAVTTGEDGYRVIAENCGDHLLFFANGNMTDAEVSAAVYDELMLDRSEQ